MTFLLTPPAGSLICPLPTSQAQAHETYINDRSLTFLDINLYALCHRIPMGKRAHQKKTDGKTIRFFSGDIDIYSVINCRFRALNTPSTAANKTTELHSLSAHTHYTRFKSFVFLTNVLHLRHISLKQNLSFSA